MIIVRHRQDWRNFGCREVVLSKNKVEESFGRRLALFSITKRLWGTSEVDETYRFLEVASNAGKS